MHAVIPRGGGDQDWRIRLLPFQTVIRGKPADEFPLLGIVGIAVFAHPTRTGQQSVKPSHIEQRHLADDAAKEVGPHRQHVAHQQSAVASPLDPQMLRRCDLPGDQVLGHRDEVFVGPGTVCLEGRLVPLRAELTAAPDVRHHVDMFSLEPRGAGNRLVARQQRNLEAAVAVEQRRRAAVGRQVLGANLKIGHPRAIFGDRLMLADPQPGGIEKRWRLLEPFRHGCLGCGTDGSQRQGRWLKRTGCDQKKIVRFQIVNRDARGRAVFGEALQRLALPRAIAKAEREQPVADVVERGDDQMVACGGEGYQRRPRRGLEEHVDRAITSEKTF